MRVRGAGGRGLCICAALVLSALLAAPAWAGSPPTVSSVSPHYGGTYSRLRVEGTNFFEVLEVRFGSVGTTHFIGENKLLLVTPPALEAGTVHVTVVTSSGTSEATSADLFTTLVSPEYGRCLKFYGGAGEYRTNTCKGGSEVYAPYTWFPAFGPVEPLAKTGLKAAGSELKLQTVGGTTITCSAVAGTGEYTAAQTITQTLTLTGCHDGAGNCQSAGAAAGEVRTSPLQGSLGFYGSRREVGQELTAESGEVVAEFECAGTPVTLRGGVIGGLKKADKMATVATWKAGEKKGVQAVTGFIGGPTVTLEAKLGAGGYEGAAVRANFAEASEEAVEIFTE